VCGPVLRRSVGRSVGLDSSGSRGGGGGGGAHVSTFVYGTRKRIMNGKRWQAYSSSSSSTSSAPCTDARQRCVAGRPTDRRSVRRVTTRGRTLPQIRTTSADCLRRHRRRTRSLLRFGGQTTALRSSATEFELHAAVCQCQCRCQCQSIIFSVA